MEALFPSLEAAVFEAADSLECIALFAGGDRAKLRVLVCKKTTIIFKIIQDNSGIVRIFFQVGLRAIFVLRKGVLRLF